ncbi:MAG: proline racemase family protein [Acidimicrobiales bacterium]
MENWNERALTSVDYHTAGEPFRILDVGPMEGTTVLDRRSWAQENLDDLRQFLINEPRGHADMYGGFVVPPNDTEGDLGVVFFHKDGFSTACGHGTIALVTWAIETGVLPAGQTQVVVDVPSGRLHATVTYQNDRVASVCFTNVPSFVSTTDLTVPTSQGPLTAHIAFGGAYYASVDTTDLTLSPEAAHLDALISLGREIKTHLNTHPAVDHPQDQRLSGLYGTIFFETLSHDPLHQHNVTIFADGQIDRSPCGSGTSSRLALLHHQGSLNTGDTFINQGVAGGQFTGRIIAEDAAGVLTTVEGSAHHYATTTFTLDPRDSLNLGFQLR